MVAQEQEQAGKKPSESHDSLMYKAADLEARRTQRLALLDRQLADAGASRRASSPRRSCCRSAGSTTEIPTTRRCTPSRPRRSSAAASTSCSRPSATLGRTPVEQAFNNPGFDVLSHRDGDDPIRIEVKARIAGAEDFFVTHNEVLTALNTAPRYRLALVRVDPRGPEHDEVRYLENPFAGSTLGDFDATGHRGNWDTTWAQGQGAVLMRRPTERRCRAAAEAQADRGGAAAGDDQPGVGAREVDPPRPPVDAAPLVGAPPARRGPRRAVRPARRRPVVAPRPIPDRGSPARRARAAARHHRAARRLGEHPRRGRCSPRRTRRS